MKSSAAAIWEAVSPRAPGNAIDSACEMLAGDSATFGCVRAISARIRPANSAFPFRSAAASARDTDGVARGSEARTTVDGDVVTWLADPQPASAASNPRSPTFEVAYLFAYPLATTRERGHRHTSSTSGTEGVEAAV